VANLARECKGLGFAVHLFVIGSDYARLLTEFASTFDSISLVPDAALTTPSRLLSLLGGMDVVINNNSAHLPPILGDLRRQGTKLITQLQAVDLSMHGVPCGPAYVALEYEHTLHRVTVPSRKLGNWLKAWGMPEDKVIFMPNGPGFAVPQARVITSLLARRQRTQADPLHVLFMARFDRQKGLDRLVELVRLTHSHGVPLQWRIVGQRVLMDYESQPIDFDVLRPWLWPPALDAQNLIAHYAWADVLVLTSRYEGSPLSILEAQSLGCVPLATVCGAVDEQIEDGATGYLFDNTASTEALSVAMLDRLVALQKDRDMLLQLAEQAARTRQDQSWQNNISTLSACLHEWFPAQEAR
jgi:glycosyltransferase involved in cell wall biosynthesis